MEIRRHGWKKRILSVLTTIKQKQYIGNFISAWCAPKKKQHDNPNWNGQDDTIELQMYLKHTALVVFFLSRKENYKFAIRRCPAGERGLARKYNETILNTTKCLLVINSEKKKSKRPKSKNHIAMKSSVHIQFVCRHNTIDLFIQTHNSSQSAKLREAISCGKRYFPFYHSLCLLLQLCSSYTFTKWQEILVFVEPYKQMKMFEAKTGS